MFPLVACVHTMRNTLHLISGSSFIYEPLDFFFDFSPFSAVQQFCSSAALYSRLSLLQRPIFFPRRRGHTRQSVFTRRVQRLPRDRSGPLKRLSTDFADAELLARLGKADAASRRSAETSKRALKLPANGSKQRTFTACEEDLHFRELLFDQVLPSSLPQLAELLR